MLTYYSTIFYKVYVMNIFEFTRYTVGTHYPVPVRICMTSGRPDIRIRRKTNIRVFLFTYKKKVKCTGTYMYLPYASQQFLQFIVKNCISAFSRYFLENAEKDSFSAGYPDFRQTYLASGRLPARKRPDYP